MKEYQITYIQQTHLLLHPKEGALFLGNYIKVNISALKSAKDQCQTLILR